MALDYVKVKSMEVRSVEVDIYVGTWGERGEFTAVRAGQTPEYKNHLGTAGTLPELVKRLKQTLRERTATVKVPFEQLQGSEVKQGYARGIHQKDHDILVTWDGGVKDQVSRWNSRDYMRVLTGAERAELTAVAKVAVEAELVATRARKWVSELQKPWVVDLDRLVRAAIDAKTKEMAAAEEPVDSGEASAIKS